MEQKVVLTPIKAIRAKCMECSCGSFIEVRECTITDCPLYPYRMGHRPKEDTTRLCFRVGEVCEGDVERDGTQKKTKV